MAGVLTYAPNRVSVVVGGKLLSGFGEDTFVKVMRDADAYTRVMGVDGVGSRARNNDRSGTIEITLHATAPSNSILQAFATADEQGDTGAVPVIVRDNNGATLATAVTAWVKKLPDVEYGKSVGERVWTLETDNLQLAITGNGIV